MSIERFGKLAKLTISVVPEGGPTGAQIANAVAEAAANSGSAGAAAGAAATATAAAALSGPGGLAAVAAAAAVAAGTAAATDESETTFEVMFNPESYTRKFAIEYKKVKQADGKTEKYKFVKILPQDFSLKMIIDGTGVTNLGVINIFNKNEESVYDKVEKFRKMGCTLNDKGEPNLLNIVWQNLNINCRLKDVTVNYTLFDRQGHPLRATLDANFISNEAENIDSDTTSESAPEQQGGGAPGVTNGVVISTS